MSTAGALFQTCQLTRLDQPKEQLPCNIDKFTPGYFLLFAVQAPMWMTEQFSQQAFISRRTSKLQTSF